jgi:ribonucleoside-diphosphate reductase alpha chain
MTDEFFQCVEKDKDFFLYWRSDKKEISQKVLEEQCSNIAAEYNKLYLVDDIEATFYVKKIKSKELLKLLALRNWEMGEPGILYWDRISKYNMLDNTDFKYAGTNPCGEEPLPAGGSCLLGSINLAAFVKNSFIETSVVDFKELEECTKKAVRILNDVLLEGLPLHPLQEQRESVHDWRQIGLGITGLGDMLIRMRLRYGSHESLNLVEMVMKTIATTAVLESLEMAKEFGCYPKCGKEKLIHSSFIKNLNLPSSTLKEIQEYGLYNSQLLTIAPTGSISSLFRVSSGAEPLFDFTFFRKTITLNDKETIHKVDMLVAEEYSKMFPNIVKPEYFITAEQIPYKERIAMQSTLQKYIDASISSTLNIKESSTVDTVYNIYLEAWKQGLKGCTVWRNNCKREGILTKTINNNSNSIIPSHTPVRPKELPADFHLIKYKGEQFTVAVGLLDDKPYEIFAFKMNIIVHNIGTHKGKIIRNGSDNYSFVSDYMTINNLAIELENMEEKANTIYPSLALRNGISIGEICKTMKKLDDNIASFSASIIRVLRKYEAPKELEEKCPKCGSKVIREGGCKHCSNAECSWSACGD